ncbi:hypothetical protein DM39_4310 [Burkholderia cenocepacia]|uniref:Uncharacterized protein n=1 Tax=Burkholderia cenocepacia TaxID=95486 RepID=A0AAN0RVV0_9BURK|nr:hypothetical protein DM39_4310 [Burkholderia cenocepacia]
MQSEKRRPGADDRQSAGSASYPMRTDGQPVHAGGPQPARPTGDAPGRCDRGQPAAACGDRSFFYPVSVCCLFRQPVRQGRRPDAPPTTVRAAGTERLRPVPPCLPADCVLARRCRTGRTPRRRLAHALIRKERASPARARPHKGSAATNGSRGGQAMRVVANLIHAARGRRRRRGGKALRRKADARFREYFPAAAKRLRPPLPHEFACSPTRNVSRPLHAPGAAARHDAGAAAPAAQPTRQCPASPGVAPPLSPLSP